MGPGDLCDLPRNIINDLDTKRGKPRGIVKLIADVKLHVLHLFTSYK
jgi:hypothetical protein